MAGEKETALPELEEELERRLERGGTRDLLAGFLTADKNDSEAEEK